MENTLSPSDIAEKELNLHFRNLESQASKEEGHDSILATR